MKTVEQGSGALADKGRDISESAGVGEPVLQCPRVGAP